MALLLTLMVLGYSVFMVAAIASWLRLPAQQLPPTYRPQTRISVLVAVRNEAAGIGKLLEDLTRQRYPRELFEVIIIDDFSEDGTAALVASYAKNSDLPLKLLRLENGRGEGKKTALAYGLEMATGTLIAQTDGDCRVQPDWLALLEHTYVTRGPKFISGAVCLEPGNSFFGKMQAVEFASLIGSGAAGIGLQQPTMCNGANLAYEKAAFAEVKGFAGNEQIPSGDDEFLMHKIHRHFPGKVTFLKAQGAIVHTAAQASVPAFLAQRIRWASKWKFYQNPSGQLLALLVFGVNLALLAGLFGWLAGEVAPSVFWCAFAIKSAADIVFLALILNFYNRLPLLVFWLPLQFVYMPYVVYCALAGLTGKYHWKGRNLQNAS